MIKSMTGFGRGSADVENVKATVELRTVNNRHLDVHVRMGQEFAEIELALKKQIQAALKRGRVDMTVTIERSGASGYQINRDVVQGYLDAVGTLREEFGLGGDISIDSIMRLPGVLQSATESGASDDHAATAVSSALTAALAELVAMRAVEGAELVAEMTRRVDKIESLLPMIEAKAEMLPAATRDRLEKRLAELVRGKPIDEGRLAQEVAYLAERSDIAEELARLKSHLVQFRQALRGESGEAGKRLDFLLQELNREANTTLSKSGDVEISEAAITIKAEVEKLREQVQNVE
ncbi:MAG TPA: YicC family protein [Blastocatellia bacterium]|nr:YicC family protein [Blastocatellia bacterium]